jgi:membrane protease subunit HflC
VLQFGEPAAVVTEPGLHLKAPWPFQNVLYVDKRVLMLDLPTEEVIAQDRKRLVVDAYARWRITDPCASIRRSPMRLWPKSACSRFSVRMCAASSAHRPSPRCSRASAPKLMLDIRQGVNAETQNFGIEIVDVRIRRADLPPPEQRRHLSPHAAGARA